MPLLVQNPAVKGDFEQVVILKTRVVCFNLDGRVEGFDGALVQLLAVFPKL